MKRHEAEAVSAQILEVVKSSAWLHELLAATFDEGKWAAYSIERDGGDGSDAPNPYRPPAGKPKWVDLFGIDPNFDANAGANIEELAEAIWDAMPAHRTGWRGLTNEDRDFYRGVAARLRKSGVA